jgi:effector-binding domain-containing protein
VHTDISIEDQPKQATLTIRFRSPAAELSSNFKRVYSTVAAYLGELGEAPAGAPFARYHEIDVNSLDVEAGFPVGRLVGGRGEIAASELPASRVATCVHVGPYTTIERTYDRLMAWLREHGQAPSGAPMYEFYLNDPLHAPESELETKLIVPLASALG